MRGSSTILVVDDSIGVQRAVREALAAEAGVEVVCRGDAEEAGSWLASHVPAAILCDVVLPGRTGYEFCRRVKDDARTSGCPVFLLSSPFEPFDEEEATACAADGVLGKPFTAAELRDRVGPFLQPAVAPASTATARVLGVAPSETLEEVEAADLVGEADSGPSREAERVERLLEPLAARLAEPVFRRLLDHWQQDSLPEAVTRSIAEAAERLVRRRIQELEDEVSGEPFPSKDAD